MSPWALLAGALACCAWAQKRGELALLRSQAWLQGLFLGSALVLLVLWLLKAGIEPGLKVHFLGLTAVTLVLGWRLALLAGLLPLGLLALAGLTAWQHLGIQLLAGVLLPVLLSEGGRRVVYRFLPHNLFVYFFCAGFFNAALALIGQMLAMAAWFYFGEGFKAEQVLDNYLVLMPLLAFPEALLNGMAVTVLAIYKPHWLKEFHDSDYLND
ncbi:energy-coupling factor ABC transporter permease [Gallaecimonas kandeliae]|uniref:energy-coupling factor ABC transporter permease n=1 Tax=Gallaecimonas kandeliae TaxID=3029055 RepID=UPI002647A5A1|nr:energy-coupling factor ABC transporter permease [Gallaecimonas kandeliae]WKE66859.1 energy-coupling factor ABC transporter permease [Gallaecimonas kandeliae]